jgi:hypothetical protein
MNWYQDNSVPGHLGTEHMRHFGTRHISTEWKARRAVKGEIVLHWTCTQCAQNGEQQPDPAKHVQDQQADPGLVSGYIYYSF